MRITIGTMLHQVPKLSKDERAVLELMIDPKMLADRIADYARTVSETGNLRQRIITTNKQLDRLGTTLEELEKDPKFSQGVKVQSAIRSARLDAVRVLAHNSDQIIPELTKMAEGIEFARTIDAFSPFLTEPQKATLAALEETLKLIKERSIFVKHGLTAWPRDLSDRRLRPMLTDYRVIMSRAYDIVHNPPPTEHSSDTQAHRTKLESALAPDYGLRKQALIEQYLPESMHNAAGLNSITMRALRRRLNTILKLTDNNQDELRHIAELHPQAIVEQVAFGSLIRRTRLLNQLALRDPLNKNSSYDPVLARDLRSAFIDQIIRTNDKSFFEVYSKLRVAIKSAYADPVKLYPVIDKKFIAQIFPPPTHPLKERDFSPKAVIEFLKSDNYRDWKDDSFTKQLLRELILHKIAGHHVGASRDVWIKANFPALLGFEPLRKTLDDLVSNGEIILTTPSNPSGSGLRIAR